MIVWSVRGTTEPSGSRMWRLLSTNVRIRSPTPYGGADAVLAARAAGASDEASSVAASAPKPAASSAQTIATSAPPPFSA
jgi:hypothetical protein